MINSTLFIDQTGSVHQKVAVFFMRNFSCLEAFHVTRLPCLFLVEIYS